MRYEKCPPPGGAGNGPKDGSTLAKLAEKWRVSKDELGDPLIRLNRRRGIIYEISPTTLGVWLNGRPAYWIRRIRQRFGTCDVRQLGDLEVVIAWPANGARTDELLAFVGAPKRRRLSSQHRAKLAEASRKHRFRPGHRLQKPISDGSERRSSRHRAPNRAKAARNMGAARWARRKRLNSDGGAAARAEVGAAKDHSAGLFDDVDAPDHGRGERHRP